MAANEIHVNDIGTTFSVTVVDEYSVVVDLSGVLTKQLLFKKPGGTILTKNASFVTDGTDGKIKYLSQSGDLDQYGKWSLQAFVDFGDTEWYSDIHKFTVYKNVGC